MITYASAEDTKAVYDLLCDQMGRTFDYEAFQMAYAEYIQDERITAFVAKEGESVIGFMNVRVDFQLHHMANVTEIMELAVKREYRMSGVDKELVGRAIEIARETHSDCIEVCARRTNEKDHRFYEREGFNKSHYKLKMTIR